MCILGQEVKRFEISKEDAIVGYRSWYVTKDYEKFLKSLSADYSWKKNEDASGDIDDNLMGIYNYNNNYYNYYNNNNNYNNYNYYNNYYNNYNYYYNYNYNYVTGKCKLWGKTVQHEKGYRSSLAYPESLAILDDKRWFEDKNTIKFAKHFNKTIENVAKEYNIKIIGYSELK